MAKPNQAVKQTDSQESTVGQTDRYSAKDAEVQKGIASNNVQQWKQCAITTKKGHHVRVCRTKKLYEVNVAAVTKESDDEVAFLGSLSADAKAGPWMTIAVQCLKSTQEQMFIQGQFSRLVKPTKVLQGSGGTHLKVKGMFSAKIAARRTLMLWKLLGGMP